MSETLQGQDGTLNRENAEVSGGFGVKPGENLSPEYLRLYNRLKGFREHLSWSSVRLTLPVGHEILEVSPGVATSLYTNYQRTTPLIDVAVALAEEKLFDRQVDRDFVRDRMNGMLTGYGFFVAEGTERQTRSSEVKLLARGKMQDEDTLYARVHRQSDEYQSQALRRQIAASSEDPNLDEVLVYRDEATKQYAPTRDHTFTPRLHEYTQALNMSHDLLRKVTDTMHQESQAAGGYKNVDHSHFGRIQILLLTTTQLLYQDIQYTALRPTELVHNLNYVLELYNLHVDVGSYKPRILAGEFADLEEALSSISVESRLQAMDRIAGTEMERATQETTASDIVYDRIATIVSEESFEWDEESRDSLEKIRFAFASVALPHFRKYRRSVVKEYKTYRTEGWLVGDEIILNPSETRELQAISRRGGIKTELMEAISLAPLDEAVAAIPQRIIELEDPIVNSVLGAETDDMIGHILSKINSLNYRQQVQLLLKLTDEEFELFRQRRREGFLGVLEYLDENPNIIQDPLERVRARTHLSGVTTPRYEVAAEMRRRHIALSGTYEEFWDEEFYEEENSDN